ncbi:hypothetical protein [Asticcacaulis taihuensis]|uniref:hypothetical protein n=1 Tax=Asticcacaulis taihuensis TaxID=260084 RepID=UPI003F7C0EF1
MSVTDTLSKWQMTPENIEFAGYLSRWKLAGCLIFWICGVASVVFSTVDDHAYYRWMFQPWAFPLRVLLVIGGVWLILVTLRLLIMALANTPVIQVSDGNITLWRWKAVTFPISSITEIKAISNGIYNIRIDGKKYAIARLFFRCPNLLDANMEKLINVIHF